MTQGPPTLICPHCGVAARILYIHGHGQCEWCRTNIDECCRGERAKDEDANEPPVD